MRPKPEYLEGREALENFKRGMATLFTIPKAMIFEKKRKARKPATVRKNSDADKG
jgi:hypothetical protein